MLIKLAGTALRPLGPPSANAFIGRVTETVTLDGMCPDKAIFRSRGGETLPPGFRAYLSDAVLSGPQPPDSYALASDYQYLSDGDVVRLDPSRRAIRVLYRRNARSNFLLVTERCDNYCLMCSQPPKDRDDSWLVRELMEVIPLVSPETRELGITGGEPALLGQALIDLIAHARVHLPCTALHVLSNGRRFASADLANAVASVAHPDLMFGIPLYSDLPEEHDYIVQARGAFDETIRGILNLKRAGVRVELRVVIHAQTYERLPDVARFVSRNLRFVDHVALMGLELTGFAKTNLETLWIDPIDYGPQLLEATRTLTRAGVRTSVYNHQLCTIPEEVWPFSVRSISDWKNTYFDECAPCSVRDACGGFFATSETRRSRGISARISSTLDACARE